MDRKKAEIARKFARKLMNDYTTRRLSYFEAEPGMTI
jgi:hypothetical protein